MLCIQKRRGTSRGIESNYRYAYPTHSDIKTAVSPFFISPPLVVTRGRSFIVFTFRLTLYPGILRNRATITTVPLFPRFGGGGGGGVDIGGIYFFASVLARKMAGKSFENGDNDDQAKGENQFRWIYAHIYIYTPFENGFVVRSARENGKGILMRCEELKVCVQRGGGTDIKVEGLISRGTGGGKDITVEAARIITTSLRWMEDGCVLNDSFSLQFGFLLDSVSKFIIRALTPLCARVSSYNPTFYYYTYIFTFVNFNFGNFFLKVKYEWKGLKSGGIVACYWPI